MFKLSVLIPSKNEIFLVRTIKDILENSSNETEIIAILDGYDKSWPTESIPDDPRLTLIHHSESIGQRAATNEAARLSNAKYLMKVDAHCSFDKDFDTKMMSLMAEDVTMIPIMRNLHAFDWVCKNGHRRYQGPSGICEECGESTTMDVVWIAKKNPQSTAYRFDTNMHFQYWNEFGKKQKGNLTETLSIQGSCFMVTKNKYFELDLCNEDFYSWGQQGIEVSLKSWLSGGRVLINRTTFYSHMFRTQGGDFSFPYEQSNKMVEENRKLSKDIFFNDKWSLAVHSLAWLLDKFKPIPDWHDESGKKVLEQVIESGKRFDQRRGV